jgi:hypothetical protein
MKRGYAALMKGVAPTRDAQLVFPLSMYLRRRRTTRNPQPATRNTWFDLTQSRQGAKKNE